MMLSTGFQSNAPLASPGTVNALGSSQTVSYGGGPQAVTPQNYAAAFTPGVPNLLVGDAGISQIIDPLANVQQVPVVTDTVVVNKTSPWVLAALAAIALYLFTKGQL